MPVERSAGMVIFRRTPEGRRYLVLRASMERIPERGEFWDFAKGRLEPGERGIEAARRETAEETGIRDMTLLPEFKATAHYFTRREGKPVPKYVAMFLASVEGSEVKLSWEHDQFEWLPYEGALERLSLKEMKKVLRQAENYLCGKTS